VEKFIYGKLVEGLASSTVNNAGLCLSAIYTAAIEDELVAVNSAARTGRFTQSKDRRQDVNPLTRKEALKKGWKEVPELVFWTEAGEHLDTGKLDDFWMQPDAPPAHPETKKG